MDKYQKFLIEKYKKSSWFYYANDGTKDEDVKNGLNIVQNWDNAECIIIQYENPNIIEYVLVVPEEQYLSGISIYKNGKWSNVEKNIWNRKERKIPAYKIILNFNDRIEKIKVSFIENFANDFTFSIQYQEADKEKYNEKLAMEHKAELLKVANIKVSTGADLVNIYFQPCCDSYARTEITLYKDNMMLAKYKVDEETFFKSISGLAYGKYEFILKQFDDKGNIILETDKISFSLSRPNYGGKPTIYI